MSQNGWWLTLRPPDNVSELVETLRRVGLLAQPPQCWWFAWNALQIKLPGPLTQTAELEQAWEVLRVFSTRAELRLGPAGRQRGCWLLLEEEPQKVLKDSFYQIWVISQPEVFRVEADHHLLAGQKLRLPDGVKRGEILYPQPLEYGFGSEKDADMDKALTASVWKYYDADNRLAAVRYANLELIPPGSASLDVRPFPGPKRVLPSQTDAERR